MLLDVENLTVHYSGAEALRSASFFIERGEMVCLIGNNGAGKTTALRAISGLVAPTAGEVWFEDKRIDGDQPDSIVKQGIGHVPERRALFPYMSVFENLKLGAFLRKDTDQIWRDLEEVYTHFPVLRERRRQQVRTLSGGEQQMVAIARALMGSPSLLLLDEPSIGLAPIVVREIGKVAHDINQRGTSILLVEQNARLALRLAHRGYVLELGKIVLQGESEDLLHSELVKSAYLGQ